VNELSDFNHTNSMGQPKLANVTVADVNFIAHVFHDSSMMMSSKRCVLIRCICVWN